jgi:hypothetical protein
MLDRPSCRERCVKLANEWDVVQVEEAVVA